ncbi:MAG: permease prefix domain 1-containing protein [Oscillospiraceae bacterium]|jgi:hypothetical protein|nr:permease prefix domain 1-containing protein [Oscillospiraceae bacterium]
MKERVYVDRLFADYEDSPEIKDFKEEIVGNLKERIKELVSGGLDEEKAFDKAASELGDITAIADEVGKKKRNEAIGQMYMKSKAPLTKKTAAGVTIASALLLIGVAFALIAFFSNVDVIWFYYASVIMLSVACGLYTCVGLTQETRAHYPMRSGRALAYGLACLLAILGAGLAVVSFVFGGYEMSASIVIKAALILPAVCAFIFLLATESKRQKPWLKALTERYERDAVNAIGAHIVSNVGIVNPVKAARFGVASAGMWILAIALFFTFHFAAGWQFSWLVFIFAPAVQVFMVMTIFEKKERVKE